MIKIREHFEKDPQWKFRLIHDEGDDLTECAVHMVREFYYELYLECMKTKGETGDGRAMKHIENLVWNQNKRWYAFCGLVSTRRRDGYFEYYDFFIQYVHAQTPNIYDIFIYQKEKEYCTTYHMQ